MQKWNPQNMPNANSHKGFTLVELLVAMALIILMLSIMSQAFVIATNTMQGLKDAIEMQEKVRPVMAMLQRDLSGYHFEGTKKLSDPDFWKDGPPSQGYFMLWQENPYDSFEGKTVDGNVQDLVHPLRPIFTDGINYSRSAAIANHMLAFSVKLSGTSPEEIFRTRLPGALSIFGNTVPATVPPATLQQNISDTTQQMALNDWNSRRFQSDTNSISSRWAEVAYFLGAQPNPPAILSGAFRQPASTGETQAPTPLPLFTLYRQSKTLLPSNPTVIPYVPNVVTTNPNRRFPSVLDNALNREAFFEFSCHGESLPLGGPAPTPVLLFNTPEDITVPYKRMGNRQLGNYLGFPVQTPAPVRLLPLFQDYESVGSATPPSDHQGAFTDIIATDVISFDIKLLTDNRFDFENLYEIATQNTNNVGNSLQATPASIIQPYFSHDPIRNYGSYIGSPPQPLPAFINNNRFVFDTWTKDQGASPGYGRPIYDPGMINPTTGRWMPSIIQYNAGPDRWRASTGSVDNQRVIPFWNNYANNGLRIRAIQVSIRLWDSKTNTPRQYIVVQKL